MTSQLQDEIESFLTIVLLFKKQEEEEKPWLTEFLHYLNVRNKLSTFRNFDDIQCKIYTH